jgi:hypothetical protein
VNLIPIDQHELQVLRKMKPNHYYCHNWQKEHLANKPFYL